MGAVCGTTYSQCQTGAKFCVVSVEEGVSRDTTRCECPKSISENNCGAAWEIGDEALSNHLCIGEMPVAARRRCAVDSACGEVTVDATRGISKTASDDSVHVPAKPKGGKSSAKSKAKAKLAKTGGWSRAAMGKQQKQPRQPQMQQQNQQQQENQQQTAEDLSTLTFAQRQRRFGAQSLRGGALQHQLDVLNFNPHAMRCFEQFAKRESDLVEDFAVFYHSFAHAALLYEVQAAIASLVFGYSAVNGPLPRLLRKPFARVPNAEALIQMFEGEMAQGKKDHDERYREVAISAMCSLVSLGPEVSTPVIFLHTGYGHNDRPPYLAVLQGVLIACGLSIPAAKILIGRILKLAESYNLDASKYGGSPAPDGKSGHLLQIFIRRDLVDELAYAGEPWGIVDKKRQPLSAWMDGDTDVSWGQARILTHPAFFMYDDKVRLFVASADETFQLARPRFQEELTSLIAPSIDRRVIAKESEASCSC
eukprot:TRINITY_DN30596_c0_g1_i1.p1 TRINITY_DN30596_c0_g1~~TRINITY_DN30596_c0_g1_i1.p1  ORF type:complete len:479 (+),score=55.93 TRINITY_DN30596_c0_g1_i1:201-1637(+)